MYSVKEENLVSISLVIPAVHSMLKVGTNNIVLAKRLQDKGLHEGSLTTDPVLPVSKNRPRPSPGRGLHTNIITSKVALSVCLSRFHGD